MLQHSLYRWEETWQDEPKEATLLGDVLVHNLQIWCTLTK